MVKPFVSAKEWMDLMWSTPAPKPPARNRRLCKRKLMALWFNGWRSSSSLPRVSYNEIAFGQAKNPSHSSVLPKAEKMRKLYKDKDSRMLKQEPKQEDEEHNVKQEVKDEPPEEKRGQRASSSHGLQLALPVQPSSERAHRASNTDSKGEKLASKSFSCVLKGNGKSFDLN